MAWWLEFFNRKPICLGTGSIRDAVEVAIKLAKYEGEIKSITVLPYPARPRHDEDKDGFGEGQIPSFCYRPEQCKGRRSCSQGRSCCE